MRVGTRANQRIDRHQYQSRADAKRAGVGGERTREAREIVRGIENSARVGERIPRNERGNRDGNKNGDQAVGERVPITPCKAKKRQHEDDERYRPARSQHRGTTKSDLSGGRQMRNRAQDRSAVGAQNYWPSARIVGPRELVGSDTLGECKILVQ